MDLCPLVSGIEVEADRMKTSGAAGEVPTTVLTVTKALLPAVTHPAGTAAVGCVPVTLVVANGADPHFAVASEAKFRPLIVTVKA
jgi:hypothetical protein